jgi:hypothetical protein
MLSDPIRAYINFLRPGFRTLIIATFDSGVGISKYLIRNPAELYHIRRYFETSRS